MNALSANYLASHILYYAGYDLDGYDAYAYKLSQEYPIISRIGIMDADGNIYTENETNEALSDYEMLNYYKMHK